LPPVWTGARTAALWRGWRVSQLAAFRSGFPFTVNADAVANQDPQLTRIVPGGKQLLNPAAFVKPKDSRTLGRHVFAGPGLFNVDLSVSRSFALSQAGRITVRVDGFNVLNHANLGVPGLLDWTAGVEDSKRVVALYGRKGAAATFPALIPFVETA